MNVFELIKEKLEDKQVDCFKNMNLVKDEDGINAGHIYDEYYNKSVAYEDAISIVDEVAQEYNNGWIPCSERLPKEATVYEVTEEIFINSKKQYIVEHRLFGTEGEWLCPSNRKVIAWQPLPEPYKEGGADDEH